MSDEPQDKLPRHLIFFDGLCLMCNKSVQFLMRHDHQKKFYFSSLQSDYAKQFMHKQPSWYQNIDSIVYYREGAIFIKSDAVLQIFIALGGRWRFAKLFCIIPRKIRDYIYDSIAGSRYKWFNPITSCPLPPDEWKNHFLA
ncbi:MAG: DUF393 domain-containing protein [Caldithrix sp.]|nr:DUF393 domain-containing protein [Caldithrix sp.]